MSKIEIVGSLFFVSIGWMPISHGGVITTNDIDVALDVRYFTSLSSHDFSRAVYRVKSAIQSKGTNDTYYLKHHLLQRLIEFPVTTNMVMSERQLCEKSRWLDRITDWAGDAFDVDSVIGMLASATGSCHVVTNDLEAARLAAREKDRALGWREGMVWTNWSPMLANQRAWLNEKRWREYWNKSVDEYRYKMISAAIRRLNVLWKDMEEPKREKKIRETVESFGLEMPDW